MRHLLDIARKNRWMVVFFVATELGAAFLGSFVAGYYQTLIDRLGSGLLTAGTIVCYGVGMAGLYLVSYLEEYPYNQLEHGIYLDFKLKALEKVSRIDYLAYQELGFGKIVQRIENGAAAAKGMLFDFWLRLAGNLLPTVIFSIIFIARIHTGVMLGILAGYLLVFAVSNLLLRLLYRMKERILTGEERLNHYLVRGFTEMVVLRLNRRFPHEMKKAAVARNEIVRGKTHIKMVHEAFFVLFALLVAAIKLGIILYAWKGGGLSVGSVVALLLLVDNAYTPIAIFNVLYVQYRLDQAAYSRLQSFLDCPEEKRLFMGESLPPLTGGVDICDLGFAYGQRTIFNGFSLALAPGGQYALVGESGSGKSTLAKLIAGLLCPQEGKVLLDGHDLSRVRLDSLYRQMAYIPQEAPVFDGTLRENLVFDQKAEDGELLQALDMAGLKELVSGLEKGLDTVIGERGTTLSGGERQRLALARLWFSDAAIVLLDEATSALDNLTEELVLGRLLKRLKGRTVIVVAHRLEGLKGMERIIALQGGCIQEQGGFGELLARNGYFARLYHARHKKK